MKTPNSENDTNSSTADAQNNEIIEMPNVKAPCNVETEIAAMAAEQLEKTPTKATTILSTIIKTTTATTPTTISTTALPNTDSNDDIEAPPTPAHFITPAPPPTPLASQGGNSSGSSSLQKKKRNNNRNIAKRIELEMTNGANAAAAGGAAVGSGREGGAVCVGQSSIKTSLSMTSLPPDDEKQDSRDVIKAKLRVERPYNSLKKNADRSMQLSFHSNLISSTPSGGSSNHSYTNNNNNKHHRYSWGSSAHSHSSSSLHSSAATLGLGTGKDDLWAAIQTNYNYIMDTNLLDTCKEARYELEGAVSVMDNPIDCCFKMLDETQRNEGSCEDPKELRRWLREMESKLEQSPSLSQATLFSIAELQRHLAEHSVLYHEIVSHARVVRACIRAASEREQLQQQQQQQENSTGNSTNNSFAEQNNSSLSSTDEQQQQQQKSNGGEGKSPTSPATTSSSTATNTTSTTTTPTPTATTATAAAAAATTTTKKSEGNLERLQNRYHLLYLKAYEVQLWLDGLLRKKTSTASVLNDDCDDIDDDDSSDCCDDIDGATEDDIDDVPSDLESDDDAAIHNSSSFCDLQRCHTDEDDAKVLSSKGNKLLLLHRDCIENKADCEDGDDEEEDEDEVDCGRLRYSAVVVTAAGNTYHKSGNIGLQQSTATLTDFEADSESSDLETINNAIRRQRKSSDFRYITAQKVPPAAATLAAANTRATETVATLVSHLSATSTVTNNYINNNSTVAPVATTNNNNNNAIAALAISMQQLSLDTQNNTATEAATIANYELPPATDMHTKINGAIVGVAVGELSQQQQQQQQQQHLSPTQRTTLLDIHNNIQVATVPAATTQCNSLSTTCTTATQTQQQQQLQRTPSKAKNVAVISPNCHSNMNGNHHHHHHHVGGGNGGNSNSNKSPTALRKRQQHQRHAVDISKFNRSNRKSKNCAIFYFKHLDTDNETNYGGDGGTISGDGDVVVGGRSGGGSGGLSSSTSHTSDLIKSADPSSDDDEGWLYSATPGLLDTNNSGGVGVGVGVVSSVIISNLVVDGIQSSAVSSSTTAAAAIAAAATTSVISDDSDKENKEAIAAATQAATIANHRNNSFLLSSSSSSLLSSNQISIAEIQLDTRTTTAAKASSKSIAANSNNLISSSSCCSNSSNASCSSSNDLLTEATTTTTTTTSSATATSQITQMHLYRNEMEMQLQINGHNNSENNNCSNQQQQQQQHNKRNNQQSMIAAMKNTPQQQQHFAATADSNGNTEKRSSSGMLYNGKTCYYTRADICNITDKPKEQHLLSPGKRLPPRSPAKSMKSNKSNGTMSTMSPTKEISHESIKQLVLEAEHLVRDEALKTPSKSKHSFLKISSTVKKREVIMPGPIKQRVQEWLAHQPSTPMQLSKSHEPLNSSSTATRNGDDCEASGEASETDSVPQLESESSEGFTDSIATCLQTSTNSYGNSTERMGGSAEPIVSRSAVLGYGSSNQSLNASGGGGGGGCSGLVEILKRQQTRRKSDRPWSVSCLSQLTTESAQVVTKAKAVNNVQAGLATHSISESALDSLSPRRPRTSSSAGTQAHVQQHAKNYDSKGSLKRRKTRKKKHSNSATATATGSAAAYSAGKKTVTDSGSEEISEMPKLTQSLLNNSCETMSAQQIQEVANALQSLQMATTEGGGGAHVSSSILSSEQHQLEGGEEMPNLMKPNFRVGSYTTAYMTNEARLGSLAALATYMNDEEQQGEDTTGTEDHHSSFSETAWDNYQEKYNSENYSEGFDSDAARRLMEFGDDYRNFMDSQSDCCSSLSAANNVDSLSPPRMDSLQQNETKIISQETIVSSVDHARRRRALELEYERRRKTLEIRRKSCQDSSDNQQQQQQQPQPRSPTISLSSSANALTPKNTDANYFQYKHNGDSASRKLEFGMSHSAQSLRRTSESDTSTRRRKADERRRSSRNLEKCIKVIPATTSSSSCDDSDGEKEMRNLLTQSRNRLEDTRSLKIRCHLLRPEDYTEIINTCRDNIRCLEAVLRGPPSTVLSAPCISTSKDLLAAWEDLLGWSENAAAARKMQEEMIVLKHTLIRLGNKSSFELLDTEPSIQITIEALKSEKSQLQTYRKSMLRLNASVHSWLTRQERKLQAAVAEQQLKEAAIKVADVIAAAAAEEDINVNTQNTLEQQQHQQQLEQQKAITAEITVTDSNGNQVEAHAIGVSTMKSTSTNTSTDAAEIAEKSAKLETLVQSESEFHKHLKDEVSDMYSAWDEADARINNQLEVLTTSLIAWRQLECGLSEFQQVLGKDRGTLKGLEGALDKGHATPVELAQNVKLVAKLLSEKVNVSQEQLTAVQEHLDPNHILHIAKFTASNGSLSDSGISDGGATSDGGLSERERRLGVLRRLAKQLESALAPGSEAMKSIAARMESAEDELKNLQNTCRDLIVRTAATHQNKKQLEAQRQQQQLEQDAADKLHATAAAANGNIKLNGHLHNEAGAISKKSQQKAQNLSPSKQHKNKRNERSTPVQQAGEQKTKNANSNATTALIVTDAPGDDDPADDPALEFELNSSDDDENDGAKPAKGWAWRIAKVALPMQLALFTFLCAACLMQPNCCDNLNNFSMSFTPQLRYIRGPPPI